MACSSVIAIYNWLSPSREKWASEVFKADLNALLFLVWTKALIT
jgi:hypothetical protein